MCKTFINYIFSCNLFKTYPQFGIAFFLLLLLFFWNCTLKKEYKSSENRVQFDRVTFFFPYLKHYALRWKQVRNFVLSNF